MIGFTEFLRDLFRLAHAHLPAGGAGDGPVFEWRIQRHLADTGMQRLDVFSRMRSLGSTSPRALT
jgi:hypothetical protein